MRCRCIVWAAERCGCVPCNLETANRTIAWNETTSELMRFHSAPQTIVKLIGHVSSTHSGFFNCRMLNALVAGKTKTASLVKDLLYAFPRYNSLFPLLSICSSKACFEKATVSDSPHTNQPIKNCLVTPKSELVSTLYFVRGSLSSR